MLLKGMHNNPNGSPEKIFGEIMICINIDHCNNMLKAGWDLISAELFGNSQANFLVGRNVVESFTKEEIEERREQEEKRNAESLHAF